MPDHPDWGSWGGHEFYRPALFDTDPHGFTRGVPVEPEPPAIWTNVIGACTPPVSGEYGRAVRAGGKPFKNNRVLWRWRLHALHSWLARRRSRLPGDGR